MDANREAPSGIPLDGSPPPSRSEPSSVRSRGVAWALSRLRTLLGPFLGPLRRRQESRLRALTNQVQLPLIEKELPRSRWLGCDTTLVVRQALRGLMQPDSASPLDDSIMACICALLPLSETHRDRFDSGPLELFADCLVGKTTLLAAPHTLQLLSTLIQTSDSLAQANALGLLFELPTRTDTQRFMRNVLSELAPEAFSRIDVHTGQTAFLAAVHHGRAAWVELVAPYSDVLALDHEGRNALAVASQREGLDEFTRPHMAGVTVLRYLIKRGVNVNAVDAHSRSPLDHAVEVALRRCTTDRHQRFPVTQMRRLECLAQSSSAKTLGRALQYLQVLALSKAHAAGPVPQVSALLEQHVLARAMKTKRTSAGASRSNQSTPAPGRSQNPQPNPEASVNSPSLAGVASGERRPRRL